MTRVFLLILLGVLYGCPSSQDGGSGLIAGSTGQSFGIPGTDVYSGGLQLTGDATPFEGTGDPEFSAQANITLRSGLDCSLAFVDNNGLSPDTLPPDYELKSPQELQNQLSDLEMDTANKDIKAMSQVPYEQKEQSNTLGTTKKDNVVPLEDRNKGAVALNSDGAFEDPSANQDNQYLFYSPVNGEHYYDLLKLTGLYYAITWLGESSYYLGDSCTIDTSNPYLEFFNYEGTFSALKVIRYTSFLIPPLPKLLSELGESSVTSSVYSGTIDEETGVFYTSSEFKSHSIRGQCKTANQEYKVLFAIDNIGREKIIVIRDDNQTGNISADIAEQIASQGGEAFSYYLETLQVPFLNEKEDYKSENLSIVHEGGKYWKFTIQLQGSSTPQEYLMDCQFDSRHD